MTTTKEEGNKIYKKYDMKTSILKYFMLACLIVFALTGRAQDKEPESTEEIAKELANPNTTLASMAFPIDFTFYNGDIPDANKQFSTTIGFQPSLPIPLSSSVNLFVRPMIPVILTTPIVGATGFEKRGIDLGNISADVAIGKTFPSKTIGIVGGFAGLPTATDKTIRSKQVTVGPEVMVAQIFKWGVIGAMVNHAWGVGKDDNDTADGDFSITENNPRRASVTAGQYFYVVNLKNAWQITGQPTWAYNHKAEKGNRFTFPVGTGVNKVTKIGKLPVKLSVQYWYYVASPEAFGPQHQIRVQIAPVIPLPW